MFQVIPAIDLLDGKVVRLKQGDYKQSTVYESDPVKVAKNWQAQGAKRLHLVDLNGAKLGKPFHFEVIQKIRDQVSMQIEVGGGIRTAEDVENYLKIGITYVILGSILLKDKTLALTFLKNFPNQVIVGVDGKDGMVKAEGWTEGSSVSILDLLLELEKTGAKQTIVTDISRDGMLSGPNIKLYEEIAAKTNLQIIASGGIASLEDFRDLKKNPKIVGAISGKALYEGKFSLKEALSL